MSVAALDVRLPLYGQQRMLTRKKLPKVFLRSPGAFQVAASTQERVTFPNLLVLAGQIKVEVSGGVTRAQTSCIGEHTIALDQLRQAGRRRPMTWQADAFDMQ